MEGDAQLKELYQDVLLDYYHSGAHKGRLEAPDFRSHGINPVCGDELELTARADGEGRLGQIRYSGHGCVISQASCAMLAEALEGKPVARAQELVDAFKGMMLSQTPVDSLPEDLEPLKALEGVRRFPTRIKCATLAWNTMAQGLAQGLGKNAEFEEK